MSDDPASLVLRLLRRMDKTIDRVGADIADLKVRITSIGMNLVALNGRMGRLDARVERIECRLDLVDTR